MHVEALRDHCLSKAGVEECFPFNETTLVFKVMGKMFALVGLDNDPLFVNLKCTPELAEELREEYEEITPGYHMDKRNWNSVQLTDRIPESLYREWIDLSYDLVVATLKKKDLEMLDNLER